MIRHDALRFPSNYWDHISQEAKDFCVALMQKRPKDRLPASEAVHHPWIKMASKHHSGEDAAHMLEKYDNVITSLSKFSESDDLAKLALEVIAFSTPPSKMEELRMLFQRIDTDDSGTIDFEEFKKAMALHPEYPPERLQQIFDAIDVSHNGAVDYTEFLAATIESQKTELIGRGSIKEAFNALDRDGDGYITESDLTRSLGHSATEESIKRYLTQADDKGRVSFQIFKTTMMLELASPDHKNVEEQLFRMSSGRRKDDGEEKAEES